MSQRLKCALYWAVVVATFATVHHVTSEVGPSIVGGMIAHITWVTCEAILNLRMSPILSFWILSYACLICSLVGYWFCKIRPGDPPPTFAGNVSLHLALVSLSLTLLTMCWERRKVINRFDAKDKRRYLSFIVVSAYWALSHNHFNSFVAFQCVMFYAYWRLVSHLLFVAEEQTEIYEGWIFAWVAYSAAGWPAIAHHDILATIFVARMAVCPAAVLVVMLGLDSGLNHELRKWLAERREAATLEHRGHTRPWEYAELLAEIEADP